MLLSICRVSNSRQCWVIVSFLCDEAVFRLSLLVLCVTSATRCHSGSLSVSRCYWGQKTSSPSVLAGDPAKLHTFTRLVFWGFVEQLQTFRLDFTAACKKKISVKMRRLILSVWENEQRGRTSRPGTKKKSEGPEICRWNENEQRNMR